jgi:hypothetical protein
MPQTTPELAWWVMTGAIAGLLSLLTVGVAVIGYLIKSGNEQQRSGFDRLLDKFDALQTQEYSTATTVAANKAECEERHKRIDAEMAILRGHPNIP